jgi:hypothetical protein
MTLMELDGQCDHMERGGIHARSSLAAASCQSQIPLQTPSV